MLLGSISIVLFTFVFSRYAIYRISDIMDLAEKDIDNLDGETSIEQLPEYYIKHKHDSREFYEEFIQPLEKYELRHIEVV